MWNTKSNSGFTLVELLVAIVIIVILSTIGIASFNSANSRNELQNQAKEFTSLLRKLRTESTAAVKPITGAGSVAAPSCKSPTTNPDQGVYYGTFIMMDKLNNDYAIWSLCFTPGGSQNVSAVDVIDLPEGIAFNSLPGGDRVGVFFNFNGNVYSQAFPIGSDPDFTYAQNPGSPISAPIRITLEKSGAQYFIDINGAGLVCASITNSPSCAQ